jgi:alcohol dehydrogenase, propanol-preferring
MGDSLPTKYKAMVYDQPGKISTKLVELDMPEPGAGDVLIKLYANTFMVLPHQHTTIGTNTNRSTHSGVCHSDLGIMVKGWAQLPFPTEAGQVG